jgi:hypothetical protein
MSDLEVLQLTKIANYVLSIIQLVMGLWVLSFLRHIDSLDSEIEQCAITAIIFIVAFVMVAFALWSSGLFSL